MTLQQPVGHGRADGEDVLCNCASDRIDRITMIYKTASKERFAMGKIDTEIRYGAIKNHE